MVAFTGLERMVVLNNHVLRQKLLLIPHRKLQLQLHLLPIRLLVEHPACRHLQIFGILQLNMQVELQVRTSTHLRAVQTSVKKIIELVNNDLFSNQSVTLSMRRQKPNNGRRSERRLTPQSAVAECPMLRNF